MMEDNYDINSMMRDDRSMVSVSVFNRQDCDEWNFKVFHYMRDLFRLKIER